MPTACLGAAVQITSARSYTNIRSHLSASEYFSVSAPLPHPFPHLVIFFDKRELEAGVRRLGGSLTMNDT